MINANDPLLKNWEYRQACLKLRAFFVNYTDSMYSYESWVEWEDLKNAQIGTIFAPEVGVTTGQKAGLTSAEVIDIHGTVYTVRFTCQRTNWERERIPDFVRVEKYDIAGKL